MAERLVRTTQKVSDLAFLDVIGRVARTLMGCRNNLMRDPPHGMQIKITRQELGNIVGAHAKWQVGSSGRCLGGLISVRGKTMVVHGTR
ncbi:MAG: hypothetical protein CM15mP68_4120 [Pseudomonadota bacterium]|nr:MAG: hypothetical protein CM15mP68_4120 [Pseudomonadota bacterium]